MGDMGEIFNAMKADQKKRNAKRGQDLTKLIQQMDLSHRVLNGGSHIQVMTEGGEVINCWPTTDKYQRGGKVRFGIRRMLAEITGREVPRYQQEDA